MFEEDERFSLENVGVVFDLEKHRLHKPSSMSHDGEHMQ